MSQVITMAGVRQSQYIAPDEANCSVVHIIDNDVYIFNNRLYNTLNNPVQYSADKVLFFRHDSSERDSLNQEDSKATKKSHKTIELPLNQAFEVFHCFNLINEENQKRINSLFD